MSMTTASDIAARYTRFADREVRGRSPLYEVLARGVASDPDILRFLLTLPPDKQQPNLLLASARLLFGTPTGWAGFRTALLGSPDWVRAVMLTHATQTNEPARCATLLPVLARLPQPLALIEVGASAGLCLLPDHYGYDYGRFTIEPEAANPHPVFACQASVDTPLPKVMPRIIWRAGLDLHPLDAADQADAQWLETLVWPEQAGRLAALRLALDIARVQRPPVVRGDLSGDALDELCGQAPKHATLVIFHTAVLAYVTGPDERQEFAQRAMRLCPYWLSNETPGVFPTAAKLAGHPIPGRFLLSVNSEPVAWTDPHGAAIDWIVSSTGSA